MIKVNIHQAKTHFSNLLNKLKKGETVVICNRNIPVAELRALPAPTTQPRPIGLAKKQFVVPKTFFEELPEEFLNYFNKNKE